MKKTLAMCLVAASAALMLTACGSADDASTPTPTPTPTPDPTPTPTPDPTPTPTPDPTPTPTPDPTPTPTPDPAEELKNAVLNIHGTARANHGLANLAWDDSLAQEASDYVQSALNAYSCSNPSAFDWNKWGFPPKVKDRTYGGNMVLTDNLTQAQSSAPLLDLANSFMNTIWLSGQPPYFDNSIVPSNQFIDGEKHHYRQMVWSATERIGCAHARKECSGFYMLFCYYFPAGNIPGQRALP